MADDSHPGSGLNDEQRMALDFANRRTFHVIPKESTAPPLPLFVHQLAHTFTPSPEAIEAWEFEWACYGLLPANQITMLCAPANLGKSSVAWHLLKEAAKQRDMLCYYFHADGSPGDAKTFGIDRVENVYYLLAGFGGTPSVNVMRDQIATMFRLLLEQRLEPGCLARHVFCFDALSNFVEDVNSKVEVKMWFEALKGLRALGATVLLIHHPTKRKEDDAYIFDGVNNIRSELDTLIYLDPQEDRGPWKDITVRIDKKRASYAERFIESLSLNMVDRSVAVGERQVESGDHRLLDWLEMELENVVYLTRGQAVELLRQKGCGRNEARRLIELGLTHNRWTQITPADSSEKRLVPLI